MRQVEKELAACFFGERETKEELESPHRDLDDEAGLC